MKVLRHYSKDCDPYGRKVKDFFNEWEAIFKEFTYIEVELTNNWDKPIVPVETWADNFILFSKYGSKNYYLPHEIIPTDPNIRTSPDKLMPGESFTWTIVFLTDIYDVCSVEGKIVFYYVYNMTPEKKCQDVQVAVSY